MEAVVQLRADIARSMMSGAGPEERAGQAMTSKQELDSTLARLGLALRPMHPGASDDELVRYFTLSDPSGSGLSGRDAEQVLETLRGLNAVTAAYAKPGAEPA